MQGVSFIVYPAKGARTAGLRILPRMPSEGSYWTRLQSTACREVIEVKTTELEGMLRTGVVVLVAEAAPERTRLPDPSMEQGDERLRRALDRCGIPKSTLAEAL